MGSLFTHYTGLEIHRINNTINARIIDVHYTYAYLSTYFEKKNRIKDTLTKLFIDKKVSIIIMYA